MVWNDVDFSIVWSFRYIAPRLSASTVMVQMRHWTMVISYDELWKDNHTEKPKLSAISEHLPIEHK